MHLWDVEHSYYCEPAGVYRRDHTISYANWSEYLETWGRNPPDMNLLFRYDWKKYSDGEYLYLHFIIQRHPDIYTVRVPVNREDEPQIREHLRTRSQSIRAIWEPIWNSETETEN